MIKQFILLVVLCIGVNTLVQAQTEQTKKVTINGQIMTALITEGDTLIMADLEDVSITSLRKFASNEEYNMYMYYRKCANIVYPYASEAIRIFKEVEDTTSDLNKRKKKKHIKSLQKDLKKEFQDPLKKLTKIQGRILMRMIERETNTPMYELLKGLKGSFSAGYWNQFSRLYGYDLKRGYVIGDDHILDAVLQDFNISYTLE